MVVFSSEKQGCGSTSCLGGSLHYLRSPFSLQTTIPIPQKEEGEGGGQACPFLPRLLQLDVCHPEVFRCMASDYRPVDSEFVHSDSQASYGGHVVHSADRLDVFHRPEDGYLQVLSHPDPHQYLRFVC